ncbi:L,D-transpeptidase [Levilactobacillus bambusae]|uniref:L,D-transpeptidase n=1 Tax=Levilactobacillus bambusae TaxID=2024736 RepID=A0A2V1MYG2_9LACO|nr:L,D-transpeptidase [Levilactobacillus bambusae]PWG00051.1 L,D-transpeptidase [Levilactobacillus bambusae]
MKRLLTTIGVVVVAIAIAVGLYSTQNKSTKAHQAADTAKQTVKVKKTAQPKEINWRKPSETKPYPKLKKSDWLDVDTKKERVYVKRGDKTLYTMYCSTGVGKNKTPHGTFHIQEERGTFFYNKESKEGAKYWVSWKDHGIYLFHTVPTDSKGNYIKSEAEELGKNAASHGCIRLSVADAKWVYEKVPYGMKVVIH